MAHKVLNTFEEKEHDGHVYQTGETYPAEGFKATEKRVEFLQKKHEKYDVAFLAPEEPKNEKQDKAPEAKDPEEVQDKEPVEKPVKKKKSDDAK